MKVLEVGWLLLAEVLGLLTCSAIEVNAGLLHLIGILLFTGLVALKNELKGGAAVYSLRMLQV